MINWTQQKYLRSVCHNNCEHESWIWGRMSVDIISRRICYSTRTAISDKRGFLKGWKGKKEVFGVGKSDFLESLWWTESRIAKKSSPQKISGRGTVLEFSEQNDGWGGHCAPREWGGDRGNAGVAWARVWERVSVCASVKDRVCVWDWEFEKTGREKGSERCWVSVLNLCCCPRHSFNMGGEGTEKIWFSLCAQWSPCLRAGFHLPFHPVPSPSPFLFLAQWSYLVLYPPLQKLFHPCLHSF